MRANLTRHGRRLLVCRGRAPSCVSYASPARRRPLANPVVYRSFERTFFNLLFQKPPREVRQPEYEPGWMQIMVWRSRMLDNLRPPTRKELMDSWRKLMQSKLKSRIPLNSTQALQCRRLLEYLADQSSNEQDVKPFSSADLSVLRQVLLDVNPRERSQNHLDLVKALHTVWLSGNFTGKARSPDVQWTYYVKSLCRYGGSKDALETLYSKWNDPEYAPHLGGETRLVETVARGLAREGREEELLKLIEYANSHGIPYDAGLQSVVVVYFAARDRVPETQQWLQKPIDQAYSQVQVYKEIASFVRRNSLQEWATPIFLKLGESQPKRKYWEVLLQAILAMGKDLSEVEVMMGHMVDRNGKLSPNINTINGLLRAATETKDGELEQQILSLGAKKGLAPNGETFLALMDLRLQTGDLAGAQAAYKQIKIFEPWNHDSKTDLFEEYRQLVNRLLVALCRQPQPDFKVILSILELSEEDQLGLDPETVASLCLRFLENEQHFDVMDILASHSFLYSEAQREVVQNAFMAFCLDPSTSTSRAWNGYQLLHQFFSDTSWERRMKLLAAFFDRKRPDMATHIFSHMRQHRHKSYHPTMETYIVCLEGYAQNADPEGLQLVHNMLKTDTAIQPTTKLYTALMLAYTSNHQPLKALDFWNDITQSQEGPSYASLEAVFWALEKRPGGHKQARETWERIERMDLEVPPSVYNAYVGAIAGSGNEKEIRGLIMNMATFVGSEPDAMTLAIAYNALPGQVLQRGFLEWGKKRYPQTWAELDKIGRRMNEFSLCQFKINRVLRA